MFINKLYIEKSLINTVRLQVLDAYDKLVIGTAAFNTDDSLSLGRFKS